MSRSLVEKYEQILTQDPASTVFVELAKAFIERGDHARAIEVCQQGLSHHPKSVSGRVLWGKALINLGKASEAMNQFDVAVNIDRENPHAYNLISEVLLRKGLYRSALPILRKASTLQPNDGRIKLLLEQTKGALSGGPAPVLGDENAVAEEPAPPPPAVSAPQPKASAAPAQAKQPAARPSTGGHAAVKKKEAPVEARAPLGDDAMPTVVMGAYDPNPDNGRDGQVTQALAAPGLDAPPTEMPLIQGEIDAEVEAPTQTIDLPLDQKKKPAARRPAAPPPAQQGDDVPDPFAAVPKRGNGAAEQDDVVRGMTSTFDALAEGAVDPFEAFNQQQASASPPVVQGKLDPNEPSVAVSPELMGDTQQIPVKKGAAAPKQRMLEDIPSELNEVPPTREVPLGSERGAAKKSSGGLLDEIPDLSEMPEPSSHLDVPKVDLNPQAAEAVAKEYERELRAKLAAATSKKTFLQAHGLKLAVGIGALTVALGLIGSFAYTRWKHQGKDLATAVADGRKLCNADTKESYTEALKSLATAKEMDSSSVEMWALTAYAHGMLYAEHTRAAPDKAEALDALGRTGVRQQYPEIATVVDWELSDGAAGAKQALLASSVDKSEVHSEAGRVLLADKKADDAFKRLQRAVTLLPGNVRALVALGDYYVQFEDYDSAIKVLTGPAAELSPNHASRVLTLAQARLELNLDLDQSLADVEKLPATDQLPPSQRARRELIHARLLSSAGRHDEALKRITDAAALYKDRAFDFEMATGAVAKNAGKMDTAQGSYEKALKIDPKSDDAKEGLGRVLLARSREKDLLADKRIAGGRKVSLVRGIAAARQNDWKQARAELARTQVNGKYPAEAAIYLALGEAEEEGGDKGVQMLEKLASATKKHKATVQVVLARLYMQRSDLTKAKVQLEEAAQDPNDFEANAVLGELLLNLGLPDLALEHLQKAVDRNASHLPARHLLVKTLLATGKLPEALKSAKAGADDNPKAGEAQRDYAEAAFYNGLIKEADAASQVAVKNASDDPGSWRVRAKVQFALADAKTAMKSLETANKLNAKDSETFCAIGYGFFRQGNNDTALAAFGAATQNDPKSACGRAGPFLVYPTANPNSTLKAAAEILKGSPASWDKAVILSAKAQALLQVGAGKDAKAAAEEAVQLMPAMGFTHYALAKVLFRLNANDPAAVEEAQKAAIADGGYAAARLFYADLLSRGDNEAKKRAVGEYEAFLALSTSEGDVARVRKALPDLKKRLAN